MAAVEAEDETASWLAEIRELCEVSMDAEAIRKKLQGRAVPSSLRGTIWQVVMRVRSKPDALTGQTLPIAEGDCALKRDSVELARKFGGSANADALATEMEGILGFYCRSRGVEYEPALGWAELLAPFMAVPLNRGERYNCFYVLMSKYAVKDVTKESVCFEVFRLLLLYHEPELCNVLDSLKIGPQDFAQTWIRSMFAYWCGPDVVLPLWDAYFLAEDQFFVFFLSLVLLINGRDYVLQLAENPATLAQELEAMPKNLTADDITDMCQLAEHFSLVTPQSFRADYSAKLFGSSKKRSAQVDMFGTLCLSVPVEAILRHTEGQIKFFVIDCRPLAHFDAAHLVYAYHLDASLMLDQPAIFEEEVLRLEDALAASMQHPCFMHSGIDEDAGELGMVVSRFLQRHHKYVSVVKGGFAALEKRLESYGASSSHYLVRQTGVIPGARAARAAATDRSERTSKPGGGKKAAHADADATPSESKWGSRFSSWGKALKESKAAAAESYRKGAARLAEKSAAYKQAIVEKSSAVAEKYRERRAASHAGETQYRANDVRTDEFTIDEDDDSGDQHSLGRLGGADIDLAASISRKTKAGELVCKINLLQKQSAVMYVFKCNEVNSEGYLFPTHLVLTTTHVLKLRDRSPKESVLLERRHLGTIAKITAKKKHPNLVTLVFECSADDLQHAELTAVKVITPGRGGESDQVDGEAQVTGDIPPAQPSTKADAAFSIGDADDDGLDHSSVEPDGEIATDEANAKITEGDKGGGDTDSSRVSLDSSVRVEGIGAPTPSPGPSNSQDDTYVVLREMFMIPEAQAAKMAFRDLIEALPA